MPVTFDRGDIVRVLPNRSRLPHFHVGKVLTVKNIEWTSSRARRMWDLPDHTVYLTFVDVPGGLYSNNVEKIREVSSGDSSS